MNTAYLLILLILVCCCLPILDGAPPTPLPTSLPTFDQKGFQTSPAYGFFSYIEKDPSYTSSIAFGTYFYKGITYYGDCTAWNDFMNIDLNPPVYGKPYFDSIRVTFSSYDETLINDKAKELDLTCSNAVTSNAIISNLKAGVNVSLPCGGYNWRTFKCGSNLNLCINCDGVCGLNTCPSNSFVFNPCSNCPVPKAMAGFLFTTLKRVVKYPAASKPAVINRSRTSVTVELNMSSPGNIYCAPYSYDEMPKTVLEIKFKQGSDYAGNFDGGSVNVTVNALTPSTKYLVYCYTEDFFLNKMPLEVMKVTAVNASTLCCGGIQVTKSFPFLYIKDRYRKPPIFKFELTPKPTNYTLVSLKAYQVKNCSSKSIQGLSVLDDVVQPSSYLLGPGVASEQSFIVLSEKSLGCIAIEIKANNSYGSAVIFSSLYNLPIAPPTPQVSSVVPLNDGTIAMFFDSNTDQSGYGAGWVWDCSQRLQLPPAVGKTFCKWASPTQLVIMSKLLDVGDQVTINQNGIRAAVLPQPTYPDKYVYIPQSTYTISRSTEKIYFTPVIATPAVVNNCDEFYANTAAEVGNGGRPWKGIEWNVSSPLFQNELNGLKSGVQIISKVTLPSYKVPQQGTYTISLKVTNLFLQQSMVSVQVKFTKNDGINKNEGDLRVIILGSPRLIHYRNHELSLFANATLSTCPDISDISPLISYKWVVYKDDVVVSPRLISNAYDPKNFRLDPFQLNSMTTYKIQVVAQYTNSKKAVIAGTANIQVEVRESGVQAVIKGGSSFYFLNTKRNVLVSSSRDLDFPEQTVNLTHRWSCMLDIPQYGSKCPNIEDVTNPTLVLRASVFKPGTTYLFSVLVTSLRGHTGLSTASVTFTNTTTPSVSIDTLKVKYNIDERVIITARSDFAYDGTLMWSTDSNDITSLVDISITPLEIDCTAGLLTSQLVIAANKLLPGLSYSFNLDAKFKLHPGTSSIKVLIVTNTPPYGGALAIDQNYGFAMKTVFTLSANSWTDDVEDLPLKYLFTYYAVDASSSVILVPSSELSVVKVQLGLGNFLNYYMGTCSVTAIDIYGAGGISTVGVKAELFSPLKKDAIEDMKTMLLTASQEKNGNKIMQIVSSTVSLLNFQDCTLPSVMVDKKITCSTLNRNECTNTAKTCGPCKAGFVGIFGDANVACTSATAPRIGQACSKATDCASGVCTGFPKVCSTVAKSCPNDCSGRGICKFYDEGNNELKSCSVTDNFCTATCVCGLDSVSGQQTYGKDCSVDSFNDFITISDGRQSVCTALQSTKDLQEFNYELFLSYVSTIAGVIADPLQLTELGLGSCIDFLLFLSETYPAFAKESKPADMLLNTYAGVLKKGNTFSTILDVRIRAAFLAVMDGVQRNMALGQQPFQVVTASIRSETSLNFVNNNFAKKFYVPRTPLEEKENVTVSTLSLALKSSASDLIGLGVTITQSFQKSSTDTTYVSNVMRLDMQGYAKSTGSARRQLATAPLADISVTLLNSKPVAYFKKPSSYHVFYCEISAKAYEISLKCENGRTLKHTCDGKKGTWRVSCGKFELIPVCKTWDTTTVSFVPDNQCAVVSFSSTQTQCLCSQKSMFQRKLISTQNTYQFAVGTGIVYDDDTTEYIPILGYISRVKNQNSITYANGVIVGIFLIGAVIFLFWDLADGQARSQKIYEEMEKKIISKNNFKETLNDVRTISSILDKALPRDFKSDNWHEHLWILMKKDYNFIALCMPEQFSGVFRLSNWILATWRYFPFVLGDTVLAYFLYSDDGTCEDTLHKDECLSLKSGGYIRDLCEWREDIQYCHYKEPDISFYNVVMLAAAITVASHFANKFLEFVCHRAGDIEVFDTIYREVSRKDDSLDNDADDDEDEEGRNLPPPVRLDEFTLAQTMKGKILRAAKLAKSQELMDFVSPTEEKNLLLSSKLFSEKRSNEVLIMNLKAMGLTIPKDKLVAQARIEKKILTSIREARKTSKQMVKEMNSMKEDEDREVFLLKNFLLDRFRGPRRPIALRYLFVAPPLGAAQKYTLLLIGFFCMIIMPIIFALYLYITFTYDSYIGTRAIPLWSQVLTVAILLDIFILQWFVVWIKASVVEATFGAEMSQLDRFFRRLSRIILLRTSGMLRESNAALHHFNPACRTARAFPNLPVSRLLISLGDADLPPTKKGWVREYGFRIFMFFYSFLNLVPENIEDFLIELMTIIFFYALCVALNLINWIFSVIIAVFVFAAFFGQEFKYYYDYKKRNYRPTAEDVNVFLKEEQMILQHKRKQAANNIDKTIWSSPVTNSIRRFSILVTKRLQKVGINDVEEEMAKKDEDPVPLAALRTDELAATNRVSESKDNYDSIGEIENDSTEDLPMEPIKYSIEQMNFAEKLKSPLKEKVTGGPIQNKKTGVDQQLEIEKKQKENTIGQIYYDLLNDPRATINETEDDVELVPFVKPTVVLGSSAFVKYNEDDSVSQDDPMDTKEKYFIQHRDTTRREPAIKRPERALQVVVREKERDDSGSRYVDKYIYDESIGQYRVKSKDEIRDVYKRESDSRERHSRKHESYRKNKYDDKVPTEEEIQSHGTNKRRLRSSKKIDKVDVAGPGAISTTEKESLSGQIHEDISSKFLVLTKDDSEEIPYIDFCNFEHEPGGEVAQDEVLQRHGGKLRGPGALKLRPQTPPDQFVEEDKEVEEDGSVTSKGKVRVSGAAHEYKTVHDMEAHIYHHGIKVKHLQYPTLTFDEEEEEEKEEGEKKEEK